MFAMAKSSSPWRYDGRTCEHGADHALHVDVHAKAGRDAKNGTDMQLSTHRGTQGSRQRRAGVCLIPELEKRKFFVPSDTGHYCTTCRVTETQNSQKPPLTEMRQYFWCTFFVGPP